MSRMVDRSTLEHLRLDRHWLVRSAAEDAIVRYPVPTPKPYRAGVREMTQEDWDEITKGGVLMYFANKPKASSTQQALPLLVPQSQQESNHPTLPQA